MNFFIKNIFEGKSDESVHLQFQKFSRGNFRNRALVKAKNSKGKYSISTTSEYANDLVRFLAENAGASTIKVSGVIVSTSDLTGQLDFENKKQFMGVKQYVMNSEMTGNKLVELCDKFPECFLGLSFSFGETELKVKPKAPKSAKPSTKSSDEKPTIDFCKVKTVDKRLIEQICFGAGEFKDLEIEHDFVIEDIEIPKNVSDPNMMRKLAKRKGKIVRRVISDGNTKSSEKPFVA